jgi:hypothetical protein
MGDLAEDDGKKVTSALNEVLPGGSDGGDGKELFLGDDDEDSDSDDSGSGEDDDISKMLEGYYGKTEPVANDDDDFDREDVSDIDSQHFEVDQYCQTLLRENNLEKLLEHDKKMVDDIKELDAKRQNLVYENYENFIGATDTIGKMKVDVDQMELDMEKLQAKVESISVEMVQLDVCLAPNRTKVEELVGVKRLLDRMEFLLELPQKLKDMVEERRFTHAVEAYNAGVDALKRFSNEESFKNIEKDSTTIIERMKEMLELEVSAMVKKAPTREAGHWLLPDGQREVQEFNAMVTILLPSVGVREKDQGKSTLKLLDDFFIFHTTVLEKALRKVVSAEGAAFAAVKKGQDKTVVFEDISPFLSRIHTGYLDSFLSAVKVYNSTFATVADEDCFDGSVGSRMKIFASKILDLYFIQAKNLVTHPTQLLCMEMADSPARQATESRKSQLECIVHGLRVVSSKLPLDQSLPSFQGKFSFGERLVKLAEESIRFQLRASFDLMQSSCQSRFTNIQEFAAGISEDEGGSPADLTDELNDEIEKTMDATVEAIDSILSKITPLVSETTKMMRELETPLNMALKRELVSFLDWLTHFLESHCDPFSPAHNQGEGHDGPPSPKFILVLAFMSSKMEEPYIGMIFTHLSSHCRLLQDGVHDQEHLMQKTKHATIRLTDHYADLSTFQICALFVY